jgi:hypothetical protein
MCDRAIALKVRGARFERQPVRLLQPEFGRVLDGDDALAGVDHLRQCVEHRRLARARTARDDDVEAAGALRSSARSPSCRTSNAALWHIMSSVIGLAENLRIEMAVPRRAERRHDHVDAAAVLQAGVGERGRLVDAAADLVARCAARSGTDAPRRGTGSPRAPACPCARCKSGTGPLTMMSLIDGRGRSAAPRAARGPAIRRPAPFQARTVRGG